MRNNIDLSYMIKKKDELLRMAQSVVSSISDDEVKKLLQQSINIAKDTRTANKKTIEDLIKKLNEKNDTINQSDV